MYVSNVKSSVMDKMNFVIIVNSVRTVKANDCTKWKEELTSIKVLKYYIHLNECIKQVGRGRVRIYLKFLNQVNLN